MNRLCGVVFGLNYKNKFKMWYIFYVLNIFKDTTESVKLNTGALMPLIGLGYVNIYILIVTRALPRGLNWLLKQRLLSF